MYFYNDIIFNYKKFALYFLLIVQIIGNYGLRGTYVLRSHSRKCTLAGHSTHGSHFHVRALGEYKVRGRVYTRIVATQI